MPTLKVDNAFAAATAGLAEIFASAPKLAAGDVEGRRTQTAKMLKMFSSKRPQVPGVTRKDHTIPTPDGSTILLAEFRPEGVTGASKAIYFIHGGGMILGSVDSFSQTAAASAFVNQVPLFSIDYRLAPEHPHPVPVNDCYAGLEWLHAHADELGVNASKIVILGEVG